MTPSDKRKQTIIDKWGSWEAYRAYRYYKPGQEQLRKDRAAKAGKNSKGGGFNDPEKAREASKKSWENRKK